MLFDVIGKKKRGKNRRQLGNKTRGKDENPEGSLYIQNLISILTNEIKNIQTCILTTKTVFNK